MPVKAIGEKQAEGVTQLHLFVKNFACVPPSDCACQREQGHTKNGYYRAGNKQLYMTA